MSQRDLGILYDGPTHRRVVDLSGPLEVPPLTATEMRALGAYQRRVDLERSSIYRRLKPRIRQLTGALAYQPAQDPPRVPDHPFVRVVSWNIERGTRLPGVTALFAEHPEARDADIILLNEVDRGLARSGNRDVCLELARRLDMHMLFGNGYLALAPWPLPQGQTGETNQLGMHGNAILSRHPVLQAECFSVPVTSDRHDCPDRRLGHKKGLWARVRTPAGPLTVAAIHLDSNTSPERRGWQMRGVLLHLRRRGVTERILLGGDLNTSTFDFSSMAALVMDVAGKLLVGGPLGIMEECRHPERRHERPLFDALEQEGFTWREQNPQAVETCRFEVEELEDACAVMSFPPAPMIRAIAWYLRHLGGVAPFKLDWFASRGLRPVGQPAVIHRPTFNGHRVSDHDPVLVDVAW